MKSACYIVLLLLSCIVLSCGDKIANPTKPTPDPTKPTQSGKNVIVFKVNGEYHIYEGKTTLFNGNGVYYSLTTSDDVTGIIIEASDTKYYDKITMYVKESYPEINLSYNITENYPWDRSYYQNQDAEFRADTLNSTIIFTRSDSTILSGKFEFIGKKDSLPDIYLTEGWFDLTR